MKKQTVEALIQDLKALIQVQEEKEELLIQVIKMCRDEINKPSANKTQLLASLDKFISTHYPTTH
jgi:hypothetical protein